MLKIMLEENSKDFDGREGLKSYGARINDGIDPFKETQNLD